jgi:olefin beta-lactone synthetase
MMHENIGFELQSVAQRQPDVTAIVELTAFHGDHFSTKALTYAELESLCDDYVKGLYDFGVRKGDRVALLVPAGSVLYALTFALYRLGATVVFVDPGIGIKRMGRCLDDAEPKFFIGVLKAHVARLIFGWGRRTLEKSILVGPRWLAPWRSLRYLQDLGRRVYSRALPETTGKDVAAILFTSGSTGAPKGVIYSHEMFSHQIRLLKDTYEIQPGEVDLPTFPLFGLFDPALGMTTIVPDMDPTRPAKADPKRLIAAIRQFGVTNLFGSPALLDTLTRYTSENGIGFSGLKRVLSAGAPVGRLVLERVRRMLPERADLFTPYGATECLPVASIAGQELLEPLIAERNLSGGGVCVGRPIAANTVKIIPVTDDIIENLESTLELPTGTIGEIVVLGPTTSQGYYGRPKANALSKIARHGDARRFHRMGDLGYFDDVGRLWFCGRKAHRIEQPSGFVCAVPVEQVLNQHSKVFRSAIVNGGDAGTVVAVLEFEQGAKFNAETESELRLLCTQNVPDVHIEAFYSHPGFPVDIRHNAKIDRHALGQWVLEQRT